MVATLQALDGELRATNSGQQATILELRATITQLQERFRDLETRVGQHSGNSSRPPSSECDPPSGPPWMSPGSNPPTTWPKVPSGLPAYGARGVSARSPEVAPFCQCHADGRGDLPDARPGPVRLPGRGLHREHGSSYRPPAHPRLRLTPFRRCRSSA